VYVNPDTEEFWIIDYRIYDPEADGKTKIDHVKEMLHNLYYKRDLKFKTVLMDTWYSTHYLMLYIDSLGKTFYCPLKENRQVDDTLGKEKYKRVDQLAWTDEEKVKGKTIKVKKFPRDFRVKLFRVEACECRKRRSQRNHIACAMLVWLRLKAIAKEVGKTIYQLKQGLLDDYLMAELENPRLQMAVA
jgi:macrodomain Ter protein organizer (MatP/YcbG family)